MMSVAEALLLAVIQGAAEFLPISSSGHLVLGGHLLGFKEPQLLFDIILHVGTLMSVLVFYRRDVYGVITGMWQGLRDGLKARDWRAAAAPEGARLALLVVLATLPTGVIGVLLGKLIDPEQGPSPFTPQLVCALLLVNGVILIANARFMRRVAAEARQGALTLWSITPALALIIGIAQGLAVLPGISRSGMTITVALALSVQRINAAKFSFLLSIPAILGALVLKLDLSLFSGERGFERLGLYLGAAAVAGLVGYGCLLLLTRVLQSARFHHFAWYCWAIGLLGLLALSG